MHIQELEVYDDSNRNIARGKKHPAVRQSSKGWNGSINYITDGNKKYKRWPNSNHTQYRGRQWIELDLGGNHRITKIVVYNRPDCCRRRLNGYLQRTIETKTRSFSRYNARYKFPN